MKTKIYNKSLDKLKIDYYIKSELKEITMKICELNICPLCGGTYEGYGNSTWGWWEMSTGCSTQEDYEKGEKIRCCDKCNTKKVIPARLHLSKKATIKDSNGGF